MPCEDLSHQPAHCDAPALAPTSHSLESRDNTAASGPPERTSDAPGIPEAYPAAHETDDDTFSDDEAHALLTSGTSASRRAETEDSPEWWVGCCGRAPVLGPEGGGMAVLFASFCLIFAGWVPLENLLSSFEGDLGFLCLTLLYAAVIPGSLLAPWLLARVPARAAMVCAALPYTAFGFACLGKELGAGGGAALLLPCAAALGLGCGVLWAGQGFVVKQLSQAYDIAHPSSGGSLGLFNGIGMGAAQLGGLCALCASSVLASFNLQRKVLYLLISCSLVLGNAALLALLDATANLRRRQASTAMRGGQAEGGAGAGAGPPPPPPPPPVRISAIPLLLAASPHLRLLQLTFLSGGFASAFMAGSFTADIISPCLGSAWIGFVMALRGVAGLVAGVLLGRLSDRIGRFPAYLCSLSFEGITAAYCAFGTFTTIAQAQASGDAGATGRMRALICALAICMGVGNLGSRTIAQALVGDLFDDQRALTAISTNQLTQSLAMCSGYLLGPLLTLPTKATIVLLLWLGNGLGMGLTWKLENKRVCQGKDMPQVVVKDMNDPGQGL